MFQELLRASTRVVNKTDKLPGLMEFISQWGKIGNAQINKESTYIQTVIKVTKTTALL